MTSSDLSRRITVLLGRRDEVRRTHERATRELTEYRGLRKELEQAQIVIQLVAQITQDRLEYRISELTTCAMAAIFPRPYTMKVRFDCKRGRTECALLFGMPNGSEIEPLDASGYGPVDVASFALRLTAQTLQRPRRRNVIVLDEPFKFVSKDLLPRVAELIHELSVKMGIQFIIITHEDRLIYDGDTVFRVKLINEVTQVVKEGMTVEAVPVTEAATEELEW